MTDEQLLDAAHKKMFPYRVDEFLDCTHEELERDDWGENIGFRCKRCGNGAFASLEVWKQGA